MELTQPKNDAQHQQLPLPKIIQQFTRKGVQSPNVDVDISLLSPCHSGLFLYTTGAASTKLQFGEDRWTHIIIEQTQF